MPRDKFCFILCVAVHTCLVSRKSAWVILGVIDVLVATEPKKKGAKRSQTFNSVSVCCRHTNMTTVFCNQSQHMSLVSGNLPGDVGTFSQCPIANGTAKFCVLFSPISKLFGSVIGFCVPQACSTSDITAYVRGNPLLNATYPYELLQSSQSIRDYIFCSDEGASLVPSGSSAPSAEETFSTRDLAMVVVIGLWLSIVVAATVFDYLRGVTLSSGPWQQVRRNSDGNIVHVVQPPTVVNRRWPWHRTTSAASTSAAGGTTSFDWRSLMERLRQQQQPQQAAAYSGKKRSSALPRRKHAYRPPTIVVTAEALQPDTSTLTRNLTDESLPLIPSPSAHGDGRGTVDDVNCTPKRAPAVSSSFGYGGIDASSVSPTSPTAAVLTEDDRQVTPNPTTREGTEADNTPEAAVLLPRRARRRQSKKNVVFEPSDDDCDSFVSDNAAAQRSTSRGSDRCETDDGEESGGGRLSGAERGGSMLLSMSLSDRLGHWIGEDRLEALRERREALYQYVSEKVSALPDLRDIPKLPNFQSLVVRVVLCLSLLNSFRKWRYYPESQANINIFNSIRVLAWLWIVCVDTFEYTMHIPTYTTIVNESTNPLYAFVQRQGAASFAIGTFLIISGFTTMHRIITSENRPMSAAAIVMANSMTGPQRVYETIVWYLKYFVTRVVRVLPVYAAILFLIQPLLVRAGSGPFWSTFTTSPSLNGNCRSEAWANIALINNFLPSNVADRCFPWSYYIALEFQLVLLAPIVHFLYKRMGYRWFLPLAIVLSVVSTWMRYYFAPACSSTWLSPSRYSYSLGPVYEQPHLMFVPYLAGISLYYAYRAVNQREENIKLLGQEASMILLRHSGTSKQLDLADRASFWLLFKLRSKAFRIVSIWVGLLVLLWCVIGSWLLHRDPGCNDSLGSELFGAISLVAWCLGLCLMILPMLFGFGGNVRLFLIHRLWCGVSRLVLAAYLLHPLVIGFCNANKFAPSSMEFLLFVVDSWGNVGVSLIVAFFFHLGVEQPSMHLGS